MIATDGVTLYAVTKLKGTGDDYCVNHQARKATFRLTGTAEGVIYLCRECYRKLRLEEVRDEKDNL